jgi:Bacterial TSP3 repeat/Vacuolar protein sorting-associated protein 62
MRWLVWREARSVAVCRLAGTLVLPLVLVLALAAPSPARGAPSQGWSGFIHTQTDEVGADLFQDWEQHETLRLRFLGGDEPIVGLGGYSRRITTHLGTCDLVYRLIAASGGTTDVTAPPTGFLQGNSGEYTIAQGGINVPGTESNSGCGLPPEEREVNVGFSFHAAVVQPNPVAEEGWTRLAGSAVVELAPGTGIFTTYTWSLTRLPDNDHDGIPDDEDPDDDQDGVPDSEDAFPFDPSESVDTDGDGTGNNADSDDDGDGFSDEEEIAAGTDPLDPDSHPGPPPGSPACSDGLDNDGDGLTDFPSDPGCSDTADNDETNGPPFDPVVTYAPEVRLHPRERWFPLSPSQFVAGSDLWWAHDAGCRDSLVRRAEVLSQELLGSGFYRAAETTNTGRPRCVQFGRNYLSNELTRPTDGDDRKANSRNEGFYLDLRNRYRRGVIPASLNYPNAPSLSYSYLPAVPGELGYVTYWFMYGFNNPVLSRIRGVPTNFVDLHEGEWEGITVVLGAGNQAIGVHYRTHNCSSHYTWTEMASQGYLANGLHPVVYSALGSHASYPTLGDRAIVCSVPGVNDQTRDGGAIWRTWLGTLENVRSQPWYGFGGAWGEVGTRISTGPIAPPWKAQGPPE